MMKTSEPRQTSIRTHSTEEPPLIRWIERSPYLHEARVSTADGTDLYAGYVATTTGADVWCGYVGQGCLDAEWERLAAQDRSGTREEVMDPRTAYKREREQQSALHSLRPKELPSRRVEHDRAV